MTTDRQTRQLSDLKSDNETLRRMLHARFETLEERVNELERLPVVTGNKMSVIIGWVDHLTGRKEQIPMTFDRDMAFGEANIKDLLLDVEAVFRAGRAKVLGA